MWYWEHSKQNEESSYRQASEAFNFAFKGALIFGLVGFGPQQFAYDNWPSQLSRTRNGPHDYWRSPFIGTRSATWGAACEVSPAVLGALLVPPVLYGLAAYNDSLNTVAAAKPLCDALKSDNQEVINFIKNGKSFPDLFAQCKKQK